jgi:hypothetical protein
VYSYYLINQKESTNNISTINTKEIYNKKKGKRNERGMKEEKEE